MKRLYLILIFLTCTFLGFSREYKVYGTQGGHGTYKVFGGSPLKPFGNESCSGCGVCAKKCPVAAIDASNPKETDSEKCISCMRCISICPKGARGLDPTLLATISERISPHLGGRKDNHLFL